MKIIAITFLFFLNSTIAFGKGLTYKGMVGDIGIFKDEKCRSIFVKVSHNIPSVGARFILHQKNGALVIYGNLRQEIIQFDKVCDI